MTGLCENSKSIFLKIDRSYVERRNPASCFAVQSLSILLILHSSPIFTFDLDGAEPMKQRTSIHSQYQDKPDADSIQHLVEYFARNLTERVESIFPHALGFQYVAAPAFKRQVWNTVLAVTDGIQDIPQFRHNLLIKSNRQLLQDAYGTVPAGYRLALRKVGQFAQSRDFYIRLHHHLTEHSEDHHFLNGYTQIDERLINILFSLPEPLNRFCYARHFSSPRDVNRFKGAWVLLNHSEHEDPRIWTDAAKQFDRGCSPQNIIQNKFNQAQFPEPVVKHPHLKHIATVSDLRRAAKRFKNCLMDYTGCALRGDIQFFEYLCDENPCIVMIRNDSPYGFIQGNIHSVSNEEPDFIAEVSIRRILNEQGIVERHRMERLVKYAGQIRPYKPSKNTAPADTDDDAIGLEELMIDENDLPF